MGEGVRPGLILHNGHHRYRRYHTTGLAHGRKEADKAYKAASEMFGGRALPAEILPSCLISRKGAEMGVDSVPSTTMTVEELQAGIPAFKLYQVVGLVNSGGEARRLIKQGGAYLNGERVATFDQVINDNDINGIEIVLRAGKKRFHKILIKS